MAVRKASAEWKGPFKEGSGTMRMQSGSYEGPFSAATRFGDEKGTNPEELIAAAHAGCFSMALSAGLTRAGFPPTHIDTAADVHIEKVGEGFEITRIELNTKAQVPGVDEKTFQEIAEKTKVNCPVSKALAGPKISLTAKLL